jgi:hypothetical protein
MALVSAFIFMPLLFGIIQFSYALYAYNFVNMAARQATRYSVVRGIKSCVIAPTFPNCNLGPDSTNNSAAPSVLTTYVQGLAYPGINTNNLTVTPTWLSAHVTSQVISGVTYSKTAWDATCTTTNTYNDTECNNPGNAVQVTVNYQFPLGIPFWKKLTLNLKGTSQMVINE